MNMIEQFTLGDRRILVTGASSGIGRACAVILSKLGARVVLTSRRLDALEETLRLMDNQSLHQIVPCDICDAVAVAELVKISGKIDGLVHAAGIGPMCPIGLVDDAHIQSVMKTNYFSFIELMKHYSKAKNRGDRLSVVAISSISALVGWGGVSTYSGSKGALCATVRALAIELASKGIRVNAVCPGHIRTPMLDSANAELLAANQPLGLGSPEQVATVVSFLLSDASSLMTGTCIPVDGGYTAQ